MNGDSEVAFREDDPVDEDREEPALPTHVTTSELSELLKSWDEKFNFITECLRKTQMNADRISSDLCLAAQDISSEQRRGPAPIDKHVAACPECAHRGPRRQYGDTDGIGAHHDAAL